MTDKEKMLSGEIYNANCENLVKEREKAKELCYDYNNLRPSQEKERKEILKKIKGN